MDRFIALQFILIIISVPLQLYLVAKWSYINTDSGQLFYNRINGIVNSLSPSSWFKWYINLAVDTPVSFNQELHKQKWREDTQSPAVEVFHFREKYGYYASSPITRSSHPKHVKYYVGQVIRHKIDGYRAVIIGWDEKARAPKQWLKDHSKYIKQPSYSVLLNTIDEPVHKKYIPEEHIELLTDINIFNAELPDYFIVFDGSRYVMKPWLKELYPHD